MEKAGTGLALLAVVGLLVGGTLVVPDDAAGAARSPDLPEPVAQAQRIAFTQGGDETADVDMTVAVEAELEGSVLRYVLGEATDVSSPALVDTDADHEGEASSPAPASADDPVRQAYTFVSTRDDSGDADVYVRTLPPGAAPDLPEDRWDQVRVTCDDAQETHPVLSADLNRVAYATDATGDWEVVVAEVGSECSGDDAVAPAPDPDADDLWPAWGPDDGSVFFSSTRDDPLGDLYAVRLDTQQVDRITDDPGADTQPAIVVLGTQDTEVFTWVFFTTTRFQAAGSVGMLTLEDYGGADSGPVGEQYVYDPWSPPGQVPASYAPPVGAEPSVRAVTLTSGYDVGFLLAYTAPDDHDGISTIRLATVAPNRVVGREWDAPTEGSASSPDLTAIPPVELPDSADEDAEVETRLRFTQRAGARDVMDAPFAVGAADEAVGGRSPEIRTIARGPRESEHLDDAGPSYSTDGTDVAFAAERSDEESESFGETYRDIVVADVATGAVSTLVRGEDYLFDMANPDRSPDGARVAFSGFLSDLEATRVWLVDVDDPEPVSVQEPGFSSSFAPRHPAWSPDGSWIVAEAELGYQDGLFLGVLDPVALTWTPLTMELVDPDCVRYEEEDDCSTITAWLRGREPAWSPDGTQIAVADLRLVGSEEADYFYPTGFDLEVAPGGISVVDVEPVEPTDVVGPGGTARTAGLSGTAGTAGTVSIAAAAPSDLPPAAVVDARAVTGFDRSAQIPTSLPDVVPFPDSSEEPEVLPEPPPVATTSRARIAWSDGPAWSPDGDEIVFSGQPAGRPDDRDLYAVAPDGTGLRTVTDSPAALTDPDVQPVGNLALSLAADPERLDVDETSSVTATVTNHGSIPATPTVVLALPPGLGAGDLPDGCGAEPGTDPGSSVVTCPSTQPLAAGDELTTTVPVVAQAAGQHTVAGAVTNPGAENDVADNVAEAPVQVDGPVVPPPPPPPPPVPGGDAVLDVDVALSAERAWVGGHGVDVTVTLRNTGDATATDVVLAATYPPGTAPSDLADLAPVDVTVPDGASATEDCLGAWGTCPLADLAPGAVVEITSTLDPVGPAGTGAVSASVTGRTAPPTPFGGLLGESSTADGAGPVEPDETGEPLTGEDSVDVEVVQPWVQILPDVVSPGDVVLVYGEDFPPGEDAILTWSAGITTAPGPYTVNEDGRLSIPVLVVRNDLRGNRWLRVTSGPPATVLTTPRVVDAAASDLSPDLEASLEAGLEPDPDAEPVPPCPEPPVPPEPPDSGELQDLAGPPAAAAGNDADLAWCEVDGAALVVTPTVAVAETLERR